MQPGTEHLCEHTFPGPGGHEVHAALHVRWDDDRLFGPGTVWTASYSHEPYRRDGEADGLLTLDEVKEQVAAVHSTASQT